MEMTVAGEREVDRRIQSGNYYKIGFTDAGIAPTGIYSL